MSAQESFDGRWRSMPAPRRTQSRVNNRFAPSEAQLNFIASLAKTAGVPVPVCESKMEASAAIDRLKPLADDARQAASIPTAPLIDVCHGGVYVTTDGRFVKVNESRTSGKLYGKVWDGDSWEYDGVRIIRDILRPVNAAEAAQWGHEHHQCMFCSRQLSDDGPNRSVEVGYGPRCAEKNFLPWGG